MLSNQQLVLDLSAFFMFSSRCLCWHEWKFWLSLNHQNQYRAQQRPLRSRIKVPYTYYDLEWKNCGRLCALKKDKMIPKGVMLHQDGDLEKCIEP
jgi:hypothetical protein